jgi:hypothetical protein
VSRLQVHEPGCREGELPGAIEQIIEGRPRSIGGFDVTRILPERQRRQVGPFVFLDQMGPLALPPGQGFEVPPHPHIGLATVTYLYQGEIVHRDSLGYEQTIAPGAINLMAAGRGITHSERSSLEERARGPALWGLQIWLALPAGLEESEPSFQHHPAEVFPAWTEE